MIANAAVALIGVGLVAVGAFAVAAPEAAAVMFGIPVQGNEARAYIRATATRDFAIGCWFLALLDPSSPPENDGRLADCRGLDSDWRLHQRLLECTPQHNGAAASWWIKRGLSRVWSVAVANRSQQVAEEGRASSSHLEKFG